jgi:hypothetical protein
MYYVQSQEESKVTATVQTKVTLLSSGDCTYCADSANKNCPGYLTFFR